MDERVSPDCPAGDHWSAARTRSGGAWWCPRRPGRGDSIWRAPPCRAGGGTGHEKPGPRAPAPDGARRRGVGGVVPPAPLRWTGGQESRATAARDARSLAPAGVGRGPTCCVGSPPPPRTAGLGARSPAGPRARARPRRCPDGRRTSGGRRNVRAEPAEERRGRRRVGRGRRRAGGTEWTDRRHARAPVSGSPLAFLPPSRPGEPRAARAGPSANGAAGKRRRRCRARHVHARTPRLGRVPAVLVFTVKS